MCKVFFIHLSVPYTDGTMTHILGWPDAPYPGHRLCASAPEQQLIRRTEAMGRMEIRPLSENAQKACLDVLHKNTPEFFLAQDHDPLNHPLRRRRSPIQAIPTADARWTASPSRAILRSSKHY